MKTYTHLWKDISEDGQRAGRRVRRLPRGPRGGGPQPRDHGGPAQEVQGRVPHVL